MGVGHTSESDFPARRGRLPSAGPAPVTQFRRRSEAVCARRGDRLEEAGRAEAGVRVRPQHRLPHRRRPGPRRPARARSRRSRRRSSGRRARRPPRPPPRPRRARGTVTSKSSRSEACDAVSSGPISAVRPGVQQPPPCAAPGAFSVTTCRTRRRSSSPSSRPRAASSSVAGTSRSAGTPSRPGRLPRRPAAAAAYSPSVSWCGARRVDDEHGQPGRGQVERDLLGGQASRQSRNSACARRAQQRGRSGP